uniref:phenylalanine--tRNA ligase n=1 Tax=Erythroglossum lusitanicum TaxID=2575615 RepID=A0A4D6WW01_9FLOR|nr:Phenylalanine-tRNA ligase beta subunit [Erythroglossum lusitanicum]
MKFSWKLLNYLVDLKNINFNEFIKKLTLAGFEIEEIEEQKLLKDKIIHLNITANRRDIYCIANLATEISSIFNTPLITNNKYNLINKFKYINTLNNNIIYIKSNIIYNINYDKSPQWLINSLIAHEIKPTNILNDTKEYIKLKWGQNIIYINYFSQTSIESSLIKFTKNTTDLSNNLNQLTNTYNYIIIGFPMYNYNLEDNMYNYTNHYVSAYNETIRLITTFGKGNISQSYNFFNKKLIHLIYFNKKIKINKNKIQTILGPIKNQSFKFLSTKQINNTLRQLKFKPVYNNKNKTFDIIIPNSRISDLYRTIDIIEEVGRNYGFKHFLNKLPKKIKQGKLSKRTVQIYKISDILRNMGLNEVINSSFNKKIKNNISILNVKLYNPVTEEQKILRNNIVENLIENYKYNIKQKNSRVEIFEIGKIFYKINDKIYTEETHLGGLIYNKDFIRKTWSDKPENLNWFYAKGILEFFLEKLQTKIQWQTCKKNIIKNINTDIYKLLNPIKQIAIYDSMNKEYIGILGELNNQYTKDLQNYNKEIYIFEINIEKLNKITKLNKHLNYSMKPYSLYPKVIRDINIIVNSNQNLIKIKNNLLEKNQNLIEEINITNEYYNKIKKYRSICLRITYRSNNRTLNTKDINKINQSIQKSLNEINKE